ncbi:MAG TPA: SBBP repeat-containing protein [Leptolyngbyaceae cyanobacterium]
MQQLATRDYEGASGIAVDSTGNVYITGYTQGSLAGTNTEDDA